MKGLNTKQLKPEQGAKSYGSNIATKNEENVEVGRGVKPPSLHGKHTLEDKRSFGKNEANKVELDEDMALEVRKAVVLDYIEGGGDGKGDAVEERIGEFLSSNSNFIVQHEVDELYPKGA